MNALGKVQLVGMVACLLAGCRSSAPLVFNTWSQPEPPFAPRGDSGNAFDGYWSAGMRAAEDDKEGINRVFFTPGQRESSSKRMVPAMADFARAVRKPSEFEFRTPVPFAPNPVHGGWRQITRVLVWRLEDAVKANAVGNIETLTAQSSKFGMDLMQGGAPEADLGLTLLDESRRVLAPNLDQLSPSLLGSIATILERTTQRDGWLDRTIENEKKTMLAGVQLTQDAYRKQDYELLRRELGGEVREAIEYFKQLRGQPADKQLAYFAGFAQEADVETQWAREQLSKPVQQRTPLEFADGQQRPWRRFSKHFFRTLRPLLDRQARTLARTRLLILECRIIAQIKSTGSAPADLSGFSRELCEDPFTGRPFAYEADGPAFKLYSVGPDFADNGGKTGDEYETPDLTIERGL